METAHGELVAEKERWERRCGTLENLAKRTPELEAEREALSAEVASLRSSLETAKAERTRAEALELELMNLQHEHAKSKKGGESLGRRVADLEKENAEFEAETRRLEKALEALKVSLRSLNDLEKENLALEAEAHEQRRLAKSASKEALRLKQAGDVKDASIDEMSVKLSTLERQHKKTVADLEAAVQNAERSVQYSVCD